MRKQAESALQILRVRVQNNHPVEAPMRASVHIRNREKNSRQRSEIYTLFVRT